MKLVRISSSSSFVATFVVFVALVASLAAVSACRPVGLAGDSCTAGPCEAGLTCVDGICKVVPPPPPPTPPCTQNSDCVLNGSADGRVCNSGTCGFATCFIDQQCGTRICDQGTCSDTTLCASDGDCGPGKVCTNNACRSACQSDAECPAIGGFNLEKCVDGRCAQVCLNDQTCVLNGGVCNNGVCAPPECTQDTDCTQQNGNFFCNAGRCTQFTPCTTNTDCFDPNFECNAQGRCQERPTCVVDADCGAGVCLAQHCQDAAQCASNADCTDANAPECVAGKCVAAVQCRSSTDCDPSKVCDAGHCKDAPTPTTPSTVVVRTSLGSCFAGGQGACAVPAFVGDTVNFYAGGFGDDGAPVASSFTLASNRPHAIDGATGLGTITCDAAGIDTATFDAGTGSGVDVRVTCVDASQALTVVVYDAASGIGITGMHVIVDGAELGVTDAGGAFASSSFTGGTLGVRSDDGLGVAVVDVAAPARLFLPIQVDPGTPKSAGFKAQVTGSADVSTGPVGLGLALPEVARANDATLDNVLGPPFQAALTIQVLGALPITLPSSSVLDASLPLSGEQVIKQDAFDASPAGPQSSLCLEQRFQQQFIFNLAFGAGNPQSTALDFAAQAEGMNAVMQPVGVLDAKPLVQDVNDFNGDGNTTELVPDFANFPEITATAAQPLVERVGVVTSAPPQNQAFNARAFAACGVELPTGFLSLGVAAFSGSTTGEQVKVLSPPSTIAGAERVCTVHAVSTDAATSSFVVVRASAFSAQMNAGDMLDPPTGAFVLADVPAQGDHAIVVPSIAGAQAFSVGVFDGAVTWQVFAPAAGSIALPAFINPTVLLGTTAYRFDSSLTDAFSASALRAVDDVASAVSTSP